MLTYQIKVKANGECGPSRIHLGKLDENIAVSFVFDLAEWYETYGNGIPSLILQRSGDAQPYPIVLSIDGTKATWVVSNIDTAKAGVGYAELNFSNQNDLLAKSYQILVDVTDSLAEAGEAPDPYDSWIDILTELGSETEANAQAAAGSAEEAEQSAENAEAWAVGQRNGQDVPSTDPAYHNNSKYHSEQSSGYATQSQGYAGQSEQAKNDAVRAKEAAEDAKDAAVQANTQAQQAKSDAVNARGQAVAAKEAAQTAQGKAEDARDDAIAAQGYAEQAKDDAYGYAQAAANSADQAHTSAQSMAFVSFEINLTNGCLIINNSERMDGDMFALNYTTGNMEVTI